MVYPGPLGKTEDLFGLELHQTHLDIQRNLAGLLADDECEIGYSLLRRIQKMDDELYSLFLLMEGSIE